MLHNTKMRLWTAGLLAVLAGAAAAAGPMPLEVTVADLTAAGVADAVEVEPAGERFGAPVRYFRSSETLPEGAAKKDCADCADLIAVYAADSPDVPGWASEPRQQFVKVGARLQLRAYIVSKKRIVTVTAVSEATMRRISEHLVAKFSK